MEYRYPSPVDSALSRNEHDREDGPMLPHCEWNRKPGASTPTCADAGDPRGASSGRERAVTGSEGLPSRGMEISLTRF